jgi:uracil-DNA glycosylase family 4
MNGESTTAGSTGAAEALGALKASMQDCSLCELSRGRIQVVFGVGDPDADLMFVGEGPGFHEDRQGEPFVGQAGKLLTELLGGIGLARKDVYIANVVKCRPPENRDPAPDEIDACSPHLTQQIAIIRPKVICTLGRFATKLLADTELSMTAIHGKAKEIEIAGLKTVVFPVFHPAAALYAPANRQVLEEDFKKLGRLLALGLDALRAGAAAAAGVAVASAGAPAAAPGPATPYVALPVPGKGLPGRDRPAPEHQEQLPLW